MSKIILWKLGNLEHRIMPTQLAIDRLAKLIKEAPPGDFHVIWGPDIEVVVLDVPTGATHIIQAEGQPVKCITSSEGQQPG